MEAFQRTRIPLGTQDGTGKKLTHFCWGPEQGSGCRSRRHSALLNPDGREATFEDVQHTFLTHYHKANPVYRMLDDSENPDVAFEQLSERSEQSYLCLSLDDGGCRRTVIADFP